MNYKVVNMDDNHRNVLPALKDLYDSGIGIIGMKIMGVGKLASCAKEAIDYIFSLNLIHAVTIGMTDKKMLNENLIITGE